MADLRTLRLKAGTWSLCLLPFAFLVARYLDDGLGANPIEEVIHWAGWSTLILLTSALAITPIRRLTGWNQIVKIRRLVGLFGFFYATVHLLLYVGLDQFFEWSVIIEDVLDRRYITAGFLGWVLLVPLAVTSTRGWIRRLGKRWVRLHRLVYVIVPLGVLHFFWRVKADTFWPVVFAALVASLLGFRLYWSRSGRTGKRPPKTVARPSTVSATPLAE